MKRIPVEINISTPLMIINGLADAYGIDDESDNDLIEQINQANLIVDQKWDSHTYGLIAQFVNLDCRNIWQKDKLIIAYNDIINFDPTNIKLPYRFEHRSNEYPNSLDPVSCYLICCHHQINLNNNTTYFEMAFLVKMISMPRIDRGLIGSDLTNLSLVKYFNGMAYNEYNNIQHPLVKNEKEAINNAINIWNVDISLSEQPMVDYYANYGKQQFKPSTASLKNIFKVNPFRIKIGVYFNREIPLKYYSKETLNRFYILEGIERNPSTLIEQSIYNTFHHLLQPEVKETETSFLKEDISDINAAELISYGVLSCSYNEYSSNTMKIYSIEELMAMFQAQKHFVDTITGERFSENSIIKLTNICLGLINNPKTNSTTKQKAKELKDAIEMVNIRQKGLNDKIKEWISHADGNKSVIKCLKLLLDAGMYMRAWKGSPHPYPIIKSEVDDQDRIDRDVSLALIKFSEANNQLDDNLKVDKLPLTKYIKGHFVESDSEHEGYTIGDRIEIVTKGNRIKKMSSCIRLSSNFIVASAYRYLQILGNPPNFSIGALIDVS